MRRFVIALALVVASAASSHLPNATCTSTDASGWTSVVGTLTHFCTLGTAAKEWHRFPCPRCHRGCIECLDGNIVALGWTCALLAPEGTVMSVQGVTQHMKANATVVGLMYTNCVGTYRGACVTFLTPVATGVLRTAQVLGTYGAYDARCKKASRSTQQ
jgi:hypothetical protein